MFLVQLHRHHPLMLGGCNLVHGSLHRGTPFDSTILVAVNSEKSEKKWKMKKVKCGKWTNNTHQYVILTATEASCTVTCVHLFKLKFMNENNRTQYTIFACWILFFYSQFLYNFKAISLHFAMFCVKIFLYNFILFISIFLPGFSTLRWSMDVKVKCRK